ncbi:MAG: hypothetical protein ACRDKW_08695 [Actinomycetota bacterium]
MNDHMRSEGAGPLEEALQGGRGRTDAGAEASDTPISRSGNQQTDRDFGGPPGGGGRASFTTPGAVASVGSMASRSEKFSDPVAGEAEAGAAMLEDARRNM